MTTSEPVRPGRRLALGLWLAWLAACGATTTLALGWRIDNRLSNWVAQAGGDAGYALLQERFGGDELVLVRCAGLDGAEPADVAWLRSGVRRLRAEPAVHDVLDPSETFEVARDVSANSRAPERGADAFELAQLARRPVVRALDLVDAARGRLDLVLSIAPDAQPEQRAALAASLRTLRDEATAHGLELRAAGHPLLSTALDAEAARIERVFAPLLVLCAFLATALCLRSFRLALIACLPAILASSGARAGLALCGVAGDLILVSVGPVSFVVVLASTLHLVVAFRRRTRLGEPPQAAARAALREKLGAGLLASVTTATGFGIFVLAQLRSVELFGATVALAVLIVVPLAFFGCTPLLAACPPSSGSRARTRTGSRRWRRLALGATRRRRLVGAALVPLLVAGALAGANLPHETNALHYFPAGHAVRDDFVALEAEGAALSTVELVLRAADDGPAWSPLAPAWSEVRAALTSTSGVRGVFGPGDVAAEVRERAGFAAALVAPAAQRRAARLSEDGRLARWTLRFPTGGEDQCRALFAALESVAHDLVGRPLGAVVVSEAFVAGSLPATLAMQRTLVETLTSSLAWTLLATTLFFLVVVRSLRDLASAVVVNLVPVAAVLTTAYALSFPLDGATVMVAAVVLGLAVDNTFHILHAARGRSPRLRVRAFARVAPAAAISSSALALGFATLVCSGFAPTARFGLLTAIGACAALVADLVVLPALWRWWPRSRSN